MVTTLRNADGSWAAPFFVSSSSSAPSTAVLSGAIPLVAGYATQGIEIFNASVAHAPGASDQNLQTQLGGCCGYSPKMALDSAGHLWIAWYSNATGATGMYVEQLDPATGAPIGPPVPAPNSESVNNNSFGARPRVRGHLPPRLRQLAGGRLHGHDRLLVARAGGADDHRRTWPAPGRARGAW